MIEEYQANPNTYPVCRKKRLLLLKNIGEVMEIPSLKDQLHFLSVRDFFGLSVLEKEGVLVLEWANKYHDKDVVTSGLFGAKDPPQDREVISHYLLRSKEFRERLKKNSMSIVVVSTEFKWITPAKLRKNCTARLKQHDV